MASEFGRRGEVAGRHAVGRREVRRVVVPHRADHGEACGLPGEHREMLADEQAGRRGGDRLETRPGSRSGASGLRSQVSIWLGPPHWKIRMHDFARPNPFSRATSPPDARARDRNRPGRPRPERVSLAPARGTSLGWVLAEESSYKPLASPSSADSWVAPTWSPAMFDEDSTFRIGQLYQADEVMSTGG